MPSISTIRRFLNGTNPEHVTFRQTYERALEIPRLVLMDDMLAVIDDGSGDWVERRNDNGETYMAFDAEALRRAKLRVAAMQQEVESLERRRMKAQSDAPVRYVITEVNYMDLPEEERARHRRHPNEPPSLSD